MFRKGVWARVVWVTPGCAITIAVFEDCKKLLMKATRSGGEDGDVDVQAAPCAASAAA